MQRSTIKLASFILLLVMSSLSVGQGQISTNTKAGNVTGHYRLHREEFRNRIDVQQLPGKKIKFHLLALWVSHYNPENIHNGELQGIAKLENGIAVYEAENCRIRMRFRRNKVTIIQTNEAGDCDFGANVTAMGSYRKLDSKKPKFEF